MTPEEKRQARMQRFTSNTGEQNQAAKNKRPLSTAQEESDDQEDQINKATKVESDDPNLTDSVQDIPGDGDDDEVTTTEWRSDKKYKLIKYFKIAIIWLIN